MTWNDSFLALFDRCVSAYQSGNRDFPSYYSPEDLAFLNSIGCQTREFFDFVEDFCEDGQPTASTTLLIAAVRRDYLLTTQNGQLSNKVLTRDELPTFGDELEGIAYLPRILAKAKAKLRGELDPELMYGCGGDRNFLAKHGTIHLADFLRHVWACENDEQKLATWLKQQSI